MAVIDTLTVNLQAMTAGLQKGLAQAREIFSTFTTSIRKSVAGLGGVIAGAFSVHALKSFSLAGVEAADSLMTMAQQIGVTAEALNQLRHAAILNDVTQEQLVTGLKRLQKTIGEASQGNESARSTFERLGLSLTELSKTSADRQFVLVAEALNKIQDPAVRAANAVALFGRGGQDLIPLLEQGAEGIAKLGAEVAGAFSPEAQERIAAADDALKRLAESWRNLKIVAAAELGPAIVFVTDSLRELVGVLSGWRGFWDNVFTGGATRLGLSAAPSQQRFTEDPRSREQLRQQTQLLKRIETTLRREAPAVQVANF